MKLKQATLYRFFIQLKSIMTFYGLFLVFTIAIPAFFGIFLGLKNFNSYSDTGIPTMIFLLISVLLGQFAAFNVFLQNGVNRRDMFLSNVISTSGVCLLMAGLEIFLTFIFRNNKIIQFANQIPLWTYDLKVTSFKGTLLTFLVTLALCVLTASIGLLIAAAVQRFRKITLMVAGSLVVMVPIFMSSNFSILPDGLQRSLNNLSSFMIGIAPGEPRQPLHFIITLLVISLILLGIYYYFQTHQELKQKG